MARPIITLVKQHDANWNYSYADYENGKCIKKYTSEEVRELRKTHFVVII